MDIIKKVCDAFKGKKDKEDKMETNKYGMPKCTLNIPMPKVKPPRKED